MASSTVYEENHTLVWNSLWYSINFICKWNLFVKKENPKMATIDVFYQITWQTYVEFFYQNSERLLAANYFGKKYHHRWQDLKYTSGYDLFLCLCFYPCRTYLIFISFFISICFKGICQSFFTSHSKSAQIYGHIKAKLLGTFSPFT